MYFSKIKKVTFGKNIAFKINDFKHIKPIITKLYEILINNKFRYIRITNKQDLTYIKQNNYLVAPNFSGKEALFFFCKINATYYNVIIFKEELRENLETLNFNYIQIYKLKISIPKSYYNGTLFDGTVFNKNKSTYFIINDLVIYNGQLIDDTLTNKQNILNKLLNHLNKNNTFNVVINKFNPISEIEELYYDRIKNSEFDINGMIFIDPNKNNQIFNIYSNDIHTKSITAIFNMKKYTLTDVYILECLDNDQNLIKWGIARIPNMKKSLYYQNVFKNKDNLTVKCIYNLKFNKWEPVDILNKNTNYSNFNHLKNMIQQII
jgi:hypothetical protein